MTLRELNLCVAGNRGYRALMGRMLGRVAGIWLVCAVGALVGASSAWASPIAAIGGIQDPASEGVLELSILANETESGVALMSATALLDDEVVDEVVFVDGTCVDIACPVTVTLTIPTAGKPDGDHSLVILIENEDGDVFEFERSFEIDNTPPVSTPVVTVSVGSNAVLPSPPVGGEETPQPSDQGGCAAPRLSMFLAQDPLRFRRGVPVLAAGRRYRYLGQLTCRINGRRRVAPRGTLVDFRYRIGDRVVAQEPLKVRKDRRLLLKVAYPSSRVLIFRVRGSDGEVVSVRIPIRVVKVKRGRR